MARSVNQHVEAPRLVNRHLEGLADFRFDCHVNFQREGCSTLQLDLPLDLLQSRPVTSASDHARAVRSKTPRSRATDSRRSPRNHNYAGAITVTHLRRVPSDKAETSELK